MAYGLKVWTASGYVAFDSEDMDTYVKVCTSGTVYIGNGATETITIPTGFDYAYVNGPTVNVERAFEYTQTSSTAFTIKNVSGTTNFFGYVAIRLN